MANYYDLTGKGQADIPDGYIPYIPVPGYAFGAKNSGSMKLQNVSVGTVYGCWVNPNNSSEVTRQVMGTKTYTENDYQGALINYVPVSNLPTAKLQSELIGYVLRDVIGDLDVCLHQFGIVGIYVIDSFTKNLTQDPLNIPVWDNALLYEFGKVVIYDGLYYKSLNGTVFGFPPDTRPDYWQPCLWNGRVAPYRLGLKYPDFTYCMPIFISADGDPLIVGVDPILISGGAEGFPVFDYGGTLQYGTIRQDYTSQSVINNWILGHVGGEPDVWLDDLIGFGSDAIGGDPVYTPIENPYNPYLYKNQAGLIWWRNLDELKNTLSPILGYYPAQVDGPTPPKYSLKPKQPFTLVTTQSIDPLLNSFGPNSDPHTVLNYQYWRRGFTDVAVCVTDNTGGLKLSQLVTRDHLTVVKVAHYGDTFAAPDDFTTYATASVRAFDFPSIYKVGPNTYDYGVPDSSSSQSVGYYANTYLALIQPGITKVIDDPVSPPVGDYVFNRIPDSYIAAHPGEKISQCYTTYSYWPSVPWNIDIGPFQWGILFDGQASTSTGEGRTILYIDPSCANSMTNKLAQSSDTLYYSPINVIAYNLRGAVNQSATVLCGTISKDLHESLNCFRCMGMNDKPFLINWSRSETGLESNPTCYMWNTIKDDVIVLPHLTSGNWLNIPWGYTKDWIEKMSPGWRPNITSRSTDKCKSFGPFAIGASNIWESKPVVSKNEGEVVYASEVVRYDQTYKPINHPTPPWTSPVSSIPGIAGGSIATLLRITVQSVADPTVTNNLKSVSPTGFDLTIYPTLTPPMQYDGSPLHPYNEPGSYGIPSTLDWYTICQSCNWYANGVSK